MKLFVTGLCVQGNKGGPALLFSLKRQLEKWLGPETEFVFSVPGGRESVHEQRAADRYGIEIVHDCAPKDLVPPFSFVPARRARGRPWLRAFKSADAVVELSAISYVGPPVGNTSVAVRKRFRYFALAWMLRKPFLAWTQSYGPFSTRLIRWLARVDLKRQPMVFCRGEDCRDTVLELVGEATALAFPDVAISLQADTHRGETLRDELLGGARQNATAAKLATISPSAVLYSKAAGTGQTNDHVMEMAAIVKFLIQKNYAVILLPHTLRPGSDDPNECDLAVCEAIALHEDSAGGVVAREDFSAFDLKSIISCASIHIGARYHSVIASLSTAVPSISLAWHDKYKDIMRMYGVSEFVYGGGDVAELKQMIVKLENDSERVSSTLAAAQRGLSDQVDENGELFAHELKRML